jgi:outer membrane protein
MMFSMTSARAETIFGAMAKAYANNPDLNAARASLRAIDENVSIAKAGMRPHVAATATHSMVDVNGRPGNLAKYDYNNDSLGLTVTQQIFDGFQTSNRVKAAESGVYEGQETLRSREMSILYSAVQAYANIARDQQLVSIRKQNLTFLNEQLNAANARLKVGEGTSTDVSLAQAELAASQASLVAAIAQLKQSETVYLQIVGEAPAGIKQPAAVTKGLPGDVNKAVEIGWAQHPSVLAAQHSVDAAGYNVKTAEGALLPGVVLQGSVSRNINDFSSSDTATTSSVTAKITIPLYQGGAEFGQIRQAKEKLGEQRIMVDSARLNVQVTITSAYAQMEAAKATIAANKQQLQAANLGLKGIIEERNVGQATTLDVLNAQQNVLNARESIAQSERNLVVASYSVLAAMGRLTVTDQNLDVAEYQPDDHYEAVKDKWFGLRTVDGR